MSEPAHAESSRHSLIRRPSRSEVPSRCIAPRSLWPEDWWSPVHSARTALARTDAVGDGASRAMTGPRSPAASMSTEERSSYAFLLALSMASSTMST